MRVIIAATGIALALCACATEKHWVKEGAGPNTVKSDIYWCTKVHVEKYNEMNAKTPGRKVERSVDPECMRKRGYHLE